MKPLFLIITTVITLSMTTTALAGFEPSPFRDQIIQLRASAAVIHAQDFRVIKRLSVPPEPCVPPDPCQELNISLRILGNIESRLNTVQDRINSIIVEVMGTEPSPFHEDLIGPLQMIIYTSHSIADMINTFIPPLNDSIPADFMDALNSVSELAETMADTAQQAIDEITYADCARDNLMDETACPNNDNCAWIIEYDATGVTEEYCCCIGGGSIL